MFDSLLYVLKNYNGAALTQAVTHLMCTLEHTLCVLAK